MLQTYKPRQTDTKRGRENQLMFWNVCYEEFYIEKRLVGPQRQSNSPSMPMCVCVPMGDVGHWGSACIRFQDSEFCLASPQAFLLTEWTVLVPMAISQTRKYDISESGGWFLGNLVIFPLTFVISKEMWHMKIRQPNQNMNDSDNMKKAWSINN